MEADPFSSVWVLLHSLSITAYPISIGTAVSMVITVLLLIASALISGSEVAFFSLSPSNINYLQNSKTRSSSYAIKLLNNPERLLGTILVANNFVNVGIVIISSYITSSLFDFSNTVYWLSFLIQVIVITFLLLLFGEIIPKIYATHYSLSFSLFMSIPLNFMEKIFRPISSFLIFSTSIVKRRFHKKQNISIDDLSSALDLTTKDIEEEKKILKGIVEFGNIDTKEIMKSRMDVVAADITIKFNDLVDLIVKEGYSRIPIFSESFDNIKGILFIKDLLAHLHKPSSFRWQTLIRPPYFVPEKKKINELLEEFQKNKIHMAIVVDEYGGSSGIITLEDILEEIVGEIHDETDEEENFFKKVNDKTFLFEGKTLINDFYKIFEIDSDIFEDVRGEADTLAGLILEIKGEIPALNDIVVYEPFEFKIAEVDNRRIKKIRTTIK